jgi:tripartite-type tricarboxylate transporter receptor subunit TctC
MLIRIVAIVLSLACLIAPTQAQTYPTKPITVVVALAVGTGMDSVVRLYGAKLSEKFGKPVVIENRPGGAGMLTVEALQRAPADGYTLGVVTSSLMAIRPAMFTTPPYDPLKDFVPVSLYLKSPFILVSDPALPIKTVPDLIAYIKANPGKASFSASSTGGAPHLSGELFKQRFDLDSTYVPYKNSPQSIMDIAAGHVTYAFAEAGASLPLLQDGKLRALAVTSTTRLPLVPDAPPFAEAASVPGFEAVSWHVLIARSGTPPEILNRLHAEMTTIMADKDIRKSVENFGLIPIEPPSINAAQKYIGAEIEKWGGMVRSLGLNGTL